MASEPLPGTTRANTHSERFRDAIDQMRTRTDLTSKALAGVGAGAIAAIGYAEFADIFPWGGPWWGAVLLGAGVVAMIVAVGLLVRRFFLASQAMITNPDWCVTAELNNLDGDEQKLLSTAYEDSAKANGVESLSELEKRGRELERDACELEEKDAPGPADAERAKAAHRQAERIFAEVQAAQDRAAAFVVRRRGTYALFGWRSLLLLGLFVVGWYGTALGSDVLESKRKGEIEIAKECAEIPAEPKNAQVEVTLPGICG